MSLRTRYEQQATILGADRDHDWNHGGYTAITDFARGRDCNLIGGTEVSLQELLNLSSAKATGWKSQMADIERSGEPTNAFGGFAGLEGGNLSTGASQPLADALAAVNLASGDTDGYGGTSYCPVPARSPVTCSFFAAWTFALAASPGTLLITPGIGTAGTAKNLGASVATATLGTSGTAFLTVSGELNIRGTGTGTDARAYYTGLMQGKLATSGAGTLDVNQILGFTALTYNSTAANGLWHTFTGTAASVTYQLQIIRFGSWN